ncbi:NAD-P-binding protein [Stereum hirsutum FP-91666 SS1]|uniref:NAD-P-binding protein n=1 Tax=Stereum hirsutum (strain FP-91666) TaxID=721885 RepID=UPI000440ACE5|nr:NAD-P-binding protein [Stereum hirsutum FP-91666 SS1]EIM87482.1 NAD-P-binding protein [Stereum hirsutum FP-91666 SS1]
MANSSDNEAHTDTTGIDFTKKIRHDTYAFIDPLKPPSSHKSHSVFISGASKGIGRSITLSFARSGASKIAIGARSSLDSVEKEILDVASKAGHPAPLILKLHLDVLDKDNVKRAAEEVAKVFGDGGLDVLVNNAAYWERLAPLSGPDVDEWWHSWEVNVRGIFLVTNAFLPFVLKSKEKTIINVSSAGALGASPGLSAYSTGKLAVLRLTEYLVVENGAEGLIAYAVHPGAILTNMTQQLPSEAYHLLTETVELAGDTIAFLARERREWLAGRYISSTWDMEEVLSRKAEIVQKDKLKVRIVL